MLFRRTHLHKHKDIAPDEIFLDDKNLPDFNVHQFEGRIENPITRTTIIVLGAFFLLVGAIFAGRTGLLQVRDGAAYFSQSERNRLDHQLLFPERGIITDRNGVELAWNTPSTEDLGFSLRQYTKTPGYGGILGFLHYPARDKKGVYYRTDYEARTGIELFYNDLLKGVPGLRIIETDAIGNIVSSNVIDPSSPGENVRLTLDERLQSHFYSIISDVAHREDYLGGAAAMMDIRTGEILAAVSYPDFDPNVMTAAEDRETIAKYNKDPGSPFLNRVIGGVFTPGSIVKPIFAIGALNEGIITPEKEILSVGYIAVPNPYFPGKETRFNDWKAHGWVDMRTAIAQSSDVYFYEIAGGFPGQKGLGIRNVERYARMFGYGSTTGIDLPGEASGTIPNPEWKAKTFPTDPTWRIGDTYFTGIGQYGMQVTVIQALREAAIIAADGLVVQPHLASTAATTSAQLDIPRSFFKVVKEGMRETVTTGTSMNLNISDVKLATKTGTAELGVTKVRVNSWVIGFFPYENPRYAFAVVMDRGVKGNTTNASYVARKMFDWMASSTPEYFRPTP
jgi:penicillin-binding protein 2